MCDSDIELDLAGLRLLAELQAFAVLGCNNVDALKHRLLCIVRFNARLLILRRNETILRAWLPSLLFC